MVTTEHWQLQARCRGKWEIFDAQEDIEGNAHYPFLKEAQRECAKCLVSDICREKSRGELTGIWDGQPL